MAKWTEVDIYTGLVKKVDEDAPANSVAGGGVALPPDAMMKKKKKRLIDARTKEYRQHRARLEKLRAQRQAKTNNMNEEQISEMKKVEIKLHPRNIDKTIQKIVKHIGIENRGRRTKIQVIQNMSDDSVTLDGRGADVGRQVADIRNFIGFKSAKVIESVDLDENQYYEYKFRNKNDAMKAKKMLDAVQLMNFDINDDNINNGELIVDAGNKNMSKYHKEIIKKFKPKVMASEENLDEGKMKELAMKIADVYTKMKKDRTMKPFADKFRQDVKKSLDIRKSLEKVLPDYISGGNITKLMAGYKTGYSTRALPREEVDLDEDVKNAMAGFDRMIQDGGMDKKDFIKARDLYKRKDASGLRKHIYDLDTEPREAIMQNISIQDRKMFDKMYPRARSGEYLSIISYDHRDITESKDDKKRFTKGAKLKLKMGDEIIKKGMSFIDKVQEQINEFGKESLLAENNMEVLKSIVKSKSAKNIKMKDGSLKMDLFTASAIMNIYDKVNPSNKKKIEALANGKKSDLMKLQSMAMKLHKK